MPTIYYLLEDHDAPSWGAGMLYEHVRILREHGYDARALHHASRFRPTWISFDVPVEYLDDPAFAPLPSDIVVVPEVLAASELVRRFRWRRVVFVQGSFLIVRGIGGFADYAELGFEAAIAVMPHVARVVERHFGVTADVVSPFVAPYFFDASPEPRLRRVLLSDKEGYRLLGIPDQDIARHLLTTEVARRPEWSLVSLQQFEHREVARLMQTSMFLVNVFSHEAFNTTVPEAMASGCVPVCYEAGGSREYLRDGNNAFVFRNQQVYELVEFVARAMDTTDEMKPALENMREAGRATASAFRPEQTAAELIGFFSTRLGITAR